MKKHFLTLLFFIYCLSAFSQIQTRSLDSLLKVIDDHELGFGNLAISQNGKIVYQKAIGFSYIYNEDKQLPSLPDDRYKIGSVTKMFTATMIFQLTEEGKLTLDQKLNAYFPDLPNADKITITQLLTHQSGLHDYTKDTGFENWMSKPKSQEELLQIIREKGSDFQPGERNEYNNSNYLVLGYIIEKITGKTYDQNIKERIISKAKLKDTQLIKEAKHPYVSVSYKYSNGKWNSVTETDPNIHSGAGALISTSADLTTFITALFDGKLIKRSSLETMTTITHGYGSGIFSYDHDTIKGYGHNGRIEEFYTAVRYFPDSKIAIAYCTNGINFPRVDLFESIIKSCFNEKISIPFTSKSSENIAQYIGTYSAENMPVVTISVQGNKLKAETQGAQFELEPVFENYYMNTPSGYYFQFNAAQNELRIKETDNVYFLKRK